MRILFAATPATGHVNPLLGIGRMLAQQGHEVAMMTGSAFAPLVRSAGFNFYPLPGQADFDLRNIEAAFPARNGLLGPDLLHFDFDHIFLGPMGAQHAGLQALMVSFKPDAIITDHLFFGTVPLMLTPRASRPVIAVCGVSFLALPREDGLPHGVAIPFEPDGHMRTFLQQTIAPAIAEALQPIQSRFDAELARLGLVAQSDVLSFTTRNADLFWQAGSAEIDYPLAAMPDHVHYIGGWPAMPATLSLPEWSEGLPTGHRLVLVTQGTVANGDLEQLVLPTMRALSDREDVIVIGTAGGRDPAPYLDKVPANARLVRYLPFEQCLPFVDVMITNGGFGSVLQAFTAGVPVVVAAGQEDKPEIAARVAWSGAGLDLKTALPTEAQLAEAVSTILDDSRFDDRARATARSFAVLDGADLISTTLASALQKVAMPA